MVNRLTKKRAKKTFNLGQLDSKILLEMVKEPHCHNPRLLMIRSGEDVQREIHALGITAAKGKELARDLFNYYLKLEKVDHNTLLVLGDMVQALGGEIVISEQKADEKVKMDALVVGNLSIFKALSAKSKRRGSRFFRTLMGELELTVSDFLGQNNLIVEWNGRKIDFSWKTYIMGILNVTPDSFTDGGKFFDHKKAVENALTMVEDGADIIDIGGESTRPGAKPVGIEEELRRVIPVIRAIAKEADVPLSIDTTKARVAEEALSEGAEIVNDVSALRFDPNLAPLLAKERVPVVLMHMRGTPETMQKHVHYRDLIAEITKFLRERISFAVRCGIEKEKIIIDPGIGFGKSIERDNFTILRHLVEFRSLGRPVLIGPSRKAFLGHLLRLPVEEREEATAAAVAIGVMNGAHIVRVHDVKKMKRVVQVVEAIKKSESLYASPQEG